MEQFAGGDLHRAASGADGLVLTHGANGHRGAPLLVALADAFAAVGVAVLRCDLAYRVRRRTGPPSPATAGEDRESLRRAVASLRGEVAGRIFLGGQSYGGRQASLLVADDPAVADGLLLLSYPLHPPGRPDQLRTAHLPGLRRPALFVHGTKDPFGALEEIEAARRLIPAPTGLLAVEGAGHDLLRGRAAGARVSLVDRIVTAFLALTRAGDVVRR